MLKGFTQFSLTDFLPEQELDVSSLQDDASVKVKEEKEVYVKGEPTREQALKMIEEFLVKKREEEKNNPRPVQTKVVEAKKNKTVKANGWRGRPRKHFNKTITMSQTDKGLRVAGRGRPKAGETRVKITVAHDFKVEKGLFYKQDGKGLVKV